VPEPLCYTDLKNGSVYTTKWGLKYSIAYENQSNAYVFQKQLPDSDKWVALLRWYEIYKEFQDNHFKWANHYIQTHEYSPFIKKIIVSIMSPTQRFTLTGLKLVITTWNKPGQQERVEKELTKEEFFETLQKYFDIHLSNNEKEKLSFDKTAKADSKLWMTFTSK